MHNRFTYSVCKSCKQPYALHSQDNECPKNNIPEDVWRPLAQIWYDIVIPAREEFNCAFNDEKKARTRLRKEQCFPKDYQNAVRLSARYFGAYQEAIWLANWHVTPLARMIWEETDGKPPLRDLGILCRQDGFTNLSGDPLAFHLVANKLKLDEQDFAAIVEWCKLFQFAEVG